MEVSLSGGYSFAPSFRVGTFTGLDSDLVKFTAYRDDTESSGLVPAFEIRIRPQHFHFFSLQSGFQKSSSYFCSLQSKSGRKVLPEEQCIVLRTLCRIPILCIRIDVETVLINIFNLHFNCLPGCEMTCLGKGAFFLVAVVCTVPAR